MSFGQLRNVHLIGNIFLITTLLYSNLGYGQEYQVIESKRSFLQNGQKIKKDYRLFGNETVVVREKGLLIVDIEHPRNLKMTAGVYQLDSLIDRLKFKYSRHKKWVGYLEGKGLLNCKFSYKTLLVPGTDRHYEVDRIEVTDLRKAAYVAIQWTNPDQNYQGKYLMLLQEASSELFVDIIETGQSSISLSLKQYKLPYLIYSILAEDCRASLPRKVEVIL